METYTVFQQAILAKLSAHKTWNPSVLKQKVKWVYATDKHTIPAEDVAVEREILTSFVDGFVKTLVGNKLGWLPAASVVLMYKQSVAATKPFELGDML